MFISTIVGSRVGLVGKFSSKFSNLPHRSLNVFSKTNTIEKLSQSSILNVKFNSSKQLNPSSTFFFGNRSFHSSKQIESRSRSNRFVDKFSEDALDDSDEPVQVKGVKIPPEFEQHYLDADEVKGKRDGIHDRKVKRLQELHAFAKRKKMLYPERLDSAVGKVNRRKFQLEELVQSALERVFHDDLKVDKIGKLFNESRFFVVQLHLRNDFQHARVLWNVWESSMLDAVKKETQKSAVLKRIRGLLAKRIAHIKYVPELEFVHEPADKELLQRTRLERKLDTLDRTYNPEPYEKEKQVYDEIQRKLKENENENNNNNASKQNQTADGDLNDEEEDFTQTEFNESELEDMKLLASLMKEQSKQNLTAGEIPSDVIENALERMMKESQKMGSDESTKTTTRVGKK